MFVCACCEEKLATRILIIHHYRLLHPLVNVFRCSVEDCQRTFSSLTTFGRHLRVSHDDRDDGEKDASETVPEKIEKNIPVPLTLKNSLKRTKTLVVERERKSVDSLFKPVTRVDLPSQLRKSHVFEMASSSSTKPLDQSPRQSQKSRDFNRIGYLFAAKLHSHSDISRLRVASIISDVDELIIKSIESIKDSVLQAIVDGPSDMIVKKVESIFSDCGSIFSGVKTEWQCLQTFSDLQTYIEPIHYSLGERDEYVNENAVQIIKKVRVTAQFVPIRRVFQKLFELPNIFDDTLNYVNTLKENPLVVSNFVQGSLWKEMSKEFEQDLVFPLFMYFDDYETNNPLGSHKGLAKCGAVYLSIPCLPPKHQSQLQNIFLFILFNTLDREVFRNQAIFAKAIEELNFLRTTGITIQHTSGPKKIYFALSLILGDNLGLHSLFGFVTSFKSKFFCRFCMTENKTISSVFEERHCTLRTKANYEKQLSINDYTQTGIKESCIFHEIPNFHVTKNLVVDVMHDVLEGICQYDLGSILHHYIVEEKFISLSELNDKTRGFFYGYDWSTNKPPEILESHIKNKRLMMTSSEMLCFIRHVSLIAGSKIPHGNECWDLIIQLKGIVEMVTSPNYHAGWEHLFGVRVSEYLDALTKKFPGCLKPKHHFLLHYPRVMASVGPLWKICSIRFEGKHQEGKKNARASISRVNVCRSIALKHQLRLNYRLLVGTSEGVRHENIAQTKLLRDIPDWAAFEHLGSLSKSKEILTLNRIEFQGRAVTKNSVVMMVSQDEPDFYLVHCILVNERKYDLITKHLHDVYLDHHTQAYQIMNANAFTWEILPLEQHTAAHITYYVHYSDGNNYIIKDWV